MIYSKEEVSLMPSPAMPPPELLSLCSRWSKTIAKIDSIQDRIECVQSELPGLLSEKALFAKILKNITKGGTYPNIRQAMMFEDEYLLFQDGRRRFSLRMFIYEPGVYTPIHDHNSWGVTGNVSGTLEVVKYDREDDGTNENVARLRQSNRYTLRPGETELTQPLNQGIHKTGNPTKGTIIMISVYGSPVRRQYINHFDLESNRVDKIFPPRLRKKNLAAQALKALETRIDEG
jgi:predicted metal-dependent enzyme (double-stranded beta helix superfamily)